MGFLFDDGDAREPDLWAAIGVILLLITVALLVCVLSSGCACAGPASGRVQRSRPIKLIHFEIKTESGKVISRVRTWEYEDEPDCPADHPVRR